MNTKHETLDFIQVAADAGFILWVVLLAQFGDGWFTSVDTRRVVDLFTCFAAGGWFVLTTVVFYLQHTVQATRAVAAWLLVSVAVGVGTWFMRYEKPMEQSEASFSLGVGLATFLFGILLMRNRFTNQNADCPPADPGGAA